MKLNHDCVRSVLLFIESEYKLGIPLREDDFFKSDNLSKYQHDDIEYVLITLDKTPYVNSHVDYLRGRLARYSNNGLTWEGHIFLDNVRDSKVWSRTKQVASHFESVSISLLSNIGSQVISHMIEKQMGI
ncbi:DUF2513 domain-containing protein [Lactiplantibacillus plantarum]|uniref:DUF2513 domain-containing protein n=1 Tax=Lactiplantibacillus plantarum TaxID=1590 RepID=UPI0007B5531C|nr:DUF2513 domain-containing protein [Lactiplantibacillus plantarum]